MKKISKYNRFRNLGFLFIMLLSLSITSCDLQVQKNFDYTPDIPEIPVFDMTVYEYIQQDPDAEFTILKQAIDLAGMQSVYENSNYTFFLLRDGAWTSTSNGIFKDLAVANVTLIPLAKLQNILNYHIIGQYVGQESFPHVNAPIIFQTLLAGEPGTMGILREEYRFRLKINQDDAPVVNGIPTKYYSTPIPSDAQYADVAYHNFRFSNGSIAHKLSKYVRWHKF